MKNWLLWVISCVSLVAIFVGIFYLRYFNEPQLPYNSAYKDNTLSIEERIEVLLSQMTLTEKVGQMALVEKNSIKDIQDISHYSIGALLSGGGAKPDDNSKLGWLEMVKKFDEKSRGSRLGIPLLYGVDANHGHSNVPGATIFPHAIGLGKTADPELVRKIAEATSKEVKATGISWVFSPNLDAPEDSRWGRTYEAFSSDAGLNAKLGTAFIYGLQGYSSTTSGVKTLATAKHYIGAGGMQWGSSSNKNYKIDQGTTVADESRLRSDYLPPFEAAVNAGVLSVMVGLNTYGDEKMSVNTYLLTDILKKELGFRGFVVSDWYGVYEIPGGEYVATVRAINAGVDMVMLPFDYKKFINHVTIAVKSGDISAARIDDAVRRILRAKFAVGLFENPVRDIDTAGLEVVGSKEHRALAREAVSKSITVRKNIDQTIPISRDVSSVVVVGSAANNTGRQSGGWTIEWQGVDGNVIPGATSVLQGIQEVVGETVEVVNQLQSADVCIAVVGEKPYAEGWGDTQDITLLDEDIHTLSSLRPLCNKLVVVIVSGRLLRLPSAQVEKWDAIIDVWLPGSEGAGVADYLFSELR